ncbi:thioesterase [Streptomyces lunaelactis]|uniref:thioesterase II family protein n=1 Tax=Streptomyces lunaelactis TaxID=1535768 RepID=UPI0015846E8C|nr:alpha/beta fold hydrolase [Streptomyces lunaelactis]NUK01331.1 thioesterase [Streptomyces lunaelactis]NUK15562.1 thioesterase [Streptomyces lunaelactis]NUK25091.1 thioesterase [Streptomyces lunaelactis]NUK33725.1 thioesterase [Streptomyces lunaelactis]NUK41779.1 thioesterase [Streptomyces lunaelactis]
MGDWITGWPTGGSAGDSGADPLPVLLCLPPAGAGCHQFRTWQQRLSGTARVLGVQLPGREDRWHEPLPDTVEEVVEAVAAELGTAVGPGVPLVVYGHSFGGLLGYEVARLSTGTPYALVVSGCPAPGSWGVGGRRGAGAGSGSGSGEVDDAELERLLDTGDLDPGLFDEDSHTLMIEMLRKDAGLSRTYTPRAQPPLQLPLYVWGADDDETVRPEELDAWRAVTEGPFHRHRIPGGHNAVLHRPDPLLAQLAGLLDDARQSRNAIDAGA